MTQPTQSRVAFLRDRVSAVADTRDRATFQVPFRQRQLDLVRIEVPIEFPLYNLNSGRTHRAQSDWIERHGLSTEFFKDPEDPDAQRAQHEILTAMIEDEGLATDLAQKEQQNPILLTYDGFIVDGNRRTAALREQRSAENLTAVVLPAEAEASDVFETELALQMERQTKAEYNWIDQALHVAMGVKTLYRRKPRAEAIHAVAQRLNEPDKEIEAILARLTLVDVYLEWLGEPGKYHRIPADKQSASEQAFVELATREARQQFKALPELQRRAARHACFTVISQGGGYMNIRKIVDAVRRSPSEVVSRVKDELPEPLSVKLDEPLASGIDSDPGTDAKDGDLLDQLAGAEDGGRTLDGAQLLNIVSDPEHARDAAPAIVQVTDDLDEEAREARDNLEPLRKVERALKLLRDLKLSDDTQKLSDVAQRLAEIDTETARLADAVNRLHAERE